MVLVLLAATATSIEHSPYATLFRSYCARNQAGARTNRECDAKCCFRNSIWSARMRRLVRIRKSTRLNSSHITISYAVFCLKKKKKKQIHHEDHDVDQ